MKSVKDFFNPSSYENETKEEAKPAFVRGVDPKKAMGIGLDLPKDTVPFYARREVWRSPLAVPMAIGAALTFFGLGIFWVIKWPLLSTITVAGIFMFFNRIKRTNFK